MKSVKFTFDTHFEDARATPSASEKRSRKSYSAEEIEAMCTRAREEGRTDGSVRAQLALTASIGQLAAAIFEAIRYMDSEVEIIRSQAADLAVVAARKLAGAALNSAPLAAIQEALREALRQAVGQPRITIKVAPTLVAEIEHRVTGLAAEEGFEGRIAISADTALKPADCRIEWRDGGAEHSTATIDHALNELIARRFPRAGGAAPNPDSKE